MERMEVFFMKTGNIFTMLYELDGIILEKQIHWSEERRYVGWVFN